MSLFDKHQPQLQRAIKAIQERQFYAAYPEHPKAYGEEAPKQGEDRFKNLLNQNVQNNFQGEADSHEGEEVSPYTQQPLGIKYPVYKTSHLITKSEAAFKTWRKTSAEDRAGVLIESLEKIKDHFFDIAYATMHTTGQSFMMSFQASGPHSNDRALEPIALAYQELKRFPSKVLWEKPMGKISVKLEKSYTAVPRGIGLTIGCATFPIWNTVPGIFANLMAGNTVIIKPSSKSILPLAILVSCMQNTLHENGFDPCTIQLAIVSNHLAVKQLMEDDRIKLIDYTGSSSFGDYIESLPNKITFTEKAGLNSVILDSVDDLDAVIGNLAFSVSLYSGQMCTAPQNFFIPATGVKSKDKTFTYEEVVEKLKEHLTAIATNPKTGTNVLGGLLEGTVKRIFEVMKSGKVILQPADVKSEEFANIRSSSPLLLEVSQNDHAIFEQEMFGPIAVVIKTNDTKESVRLAKEMAGKHGAITCAAYTTDQDTRNLIAEEMQEVFTPVTFNLTGPIWVNQHAAFSDFHVTGGNKAGNASFTNPEFVIKRFVWVGNRSMV